MRTSWSLTGQQAREVRVAARAGALAPVAEQRALVALWQAAQPDQREFVAGEVACLLHVSPATGSVRLEQALALMSLPALTSALEDGRLTVPHALALLTDTGHLPAPLRQRVLADLLDDEGQRDEHGADLRTPGQLKAAAARAAIALDPDAARRRREQARAQAGVRGRPRPDGMAALVVDATAEQVAQAERALEARAAAMTFETPMTQGQKEVAALLHALGCDRVRVRATLECPVERAVDLHAAARAGVWMLDLRMPVAVALGLSDHPALLAGYGPIGADEARALLPAADLVRACVDASTGEVLTVDPPVRQRRWCRGAPDRAAALRRALLDMATRGGAVPDLGTDGYVPSAALVRLVDLRDVTSTFPGDATSARRSEHDHRLPWPLGRTDEGNLQSLTKHWHRAKHAGWRTRLLPDGTTRWTSPGGGTYDRRPQRTPPPPLPAKTRLPLRTRLVEPGAPPRRSVPPEPAVEPHGPPVDPTERPPPSRGPQP